MSMLMQHLCFIKRTDFTDNQVCPRASGAAICMRQGLELGANLSAIFLKAV